MRVIPPRRLILAGGGLRVIAYLGVLEVLEEYTLRHHIREYCGVSAGAFVALLLALGYKLSVIQRLCFEFDFSSLGSLEPDHVLEFTETFGLDPGDKIRHLLQRILHHKGFGPTTTFQELEASGRAKGLRVWASNLNYAKQEEFSAAKTPDMEIVEAIRASMAFPMVYTPVRHPVTGDILSDGGIYDNYPILALTPEERTDTLGITFEYSKYPVEIHDVGTFLGAVFSGYYMPAYQALLEAYKHQTIILKCQEFPALHFSATTEEKESLVAVGRQATTDFFNSAQPPQRRRSI